MGYPARLVRHASWASARCSRSHLARHPAQRPYSIKAEAASTSTLQILDPSRLTVTKTKSPKPLSKPEDLVFGREFTGVFRARLAVCFL